MLYESVEAPRFPYQKRIQNKGDLNLATEVLEGFDRIPVALKATATELKRRRTHREGKF